MQCPNCGEENYPEAATCAACGTVLDEAPQVCPRCGTENNPEARFCSSCGFALAGMTQPPGSGAPTPLWQSADGIRPRGAWKLVNDSYRVVWHNFWGFFRLAWLIVAISIPLGLIPFVGSVVAQTITVPAILIAALLALAGQDLSAFRSVRAALSRFFPLLVVYLVVFFLSLALFMSLVFAFAGPSGLGVALAVVVLPAAVYLGVRWVFLAQAVMVERLGVVAAFRRSSELVQGRWWPTFGRLVLMAIASVLILIGVVFLGILIVGLASLGGVLFGGALAIPVVAAGVLALVPFITVWEVFVTLLYIDARARKEGYSYAQVAQVLTSYD